MDVRLSKHGASKQAGFDTRAFFSSSALSLSLVYLAVIINHSNIPQIYPDQARHGSGLA